MSHMLLNLRHVPDDETAEVRELLAREGIAFYETEPNRWGISAGAIWIRDAAEVSRAKTLMAVYQDERRLRAQEEYEAALLDGSSESMWSQLRREPRRLVLILFGIGIFVALSLWPLLLAARDAAG